MRPNSRPAVENTDRHHIDLAVIPKGKSYQWIAVEILGVPQNVNEFSASGWKPVPHKRHAKLFPACNVKGKIVLDGLMLVERKASQTHAALTATQLLSGWFDEQREYGFFGSVAGREVESSATLSPGSYRHFDEREPLDVEVTIKLRLTGSQVQSADVCDISPEEYGRRVAVLLMRGGLDGLDGFLIRTVDRKAYEVFDRIKVER